MSVPTAAEIDAIAESYRGWLNFDAQHAPSAGAKKHLSNIENKARKLLEAIDGADEHASDALAMLLGEMLETDGLKMLRSMDYSAPTGRAALSEIVRLTKLLSAAAHLARDEIPKTWKKTAQRIAASGLRQLFTRHGLQFSATADDYGGTSQAVAMLLDIARKAGDAEMTIDAARKWIEFAQREKVAPKIDDGFPIP